VLFILIGSTVFSFTFNAADGHIWVEHLFKDMPGGAWGFLIVVNVLVFILGMFIDFFEIAFIVVPMLVPVAEKLLPALLPGVPVDAVMVWFGVIIAMNLQTSFLTPPFGFALFYLRSVAAKEDYNDRITGERIPAVTTAQIYKGSIAFICVQLIMVSVVVFYPKLVVGTLMDTAPKVDANKAFDDLLNADTQTREAAPPPIWRDWAPRQPLRQCTGRRHAGIRARGRREGRPDEGPARRRQGRQEEVAAPRMPMAPPSAPTNKKAPQCGAFLLGRRRVRAPCRATAGLTASALHEVVEAGFGEAEPQVRVAAEGVVFVDLLPLRVGGVDSSLYSAIDSLKAASITSFGKRNSLVPLATRRFSAAGLRAS
jgi:hypothetical protein